MRTSRVAYVVVRLLVGGRDFFLLRVHEKWGDWGLIGGHVEAYEHADWFAAARRECEEELEPLRFGLDFALERIAGAPGRWGPVESRSAGGALTEYEAAWFALRFLREPAKCLATLPDAEFTLVERRLAVSPTPDRRITPLLRRLDSALPNGLESVPEAWPNTIEENLLRIELQHVPGDRTRRAAALG